VVYFHIEEEDDDQDFAHSEPQNHLCPFSGRMVLRTALAQVLVYEYVD